MATKLNVPSFAVGLLVCSSVLVGLKIHAQAQTPKSDTPRRVSQLAEEKMEVSKLDWIMLNARVKIVEQIPVFGASHHTSALGMSYDRDKKQVSVRGFVDPDWIARVKIDEMKKALLSDAALYCVQGLGFAEADAGELSTSFNVNNDCRVDFFTWTKDGVGNLGTKDIATASGGQLVLN
jgi:hypothetical protein